VLHDRASHATIRAGAADGERSRAWPSCPQTPAACSRPVLTVGAGEDLAARELYAKYDPGACRL
jgi:hypothetical protein